MDIKIIKSNRKTVSIQIYPDLSVIVRAPKLISQRELDKILKEKDEWIKKTIEQMSLKKDKMEAYKIKPLTNEEIKELSDRALAYIPKRVLHFAKLMGVNYGRITIRNQRTRWGSCSSKGNLNFNCLLMLTPPEIIDYVVVHELCHRKEMNHSRAFWKEVEKVIPKYREHKKWLKDEGSLVIRRIQMRN